MMKVSDYILKFVAGLGVTKVFYVPGGGAMHLNDSLGRNPDLEGVSMLHEQGASIAAEASARVQDGYGVCLVTSGPGATNALTGLVGAYLDSIPVIFLSGQVKRADLAAGQGVRQFGIQEVDILSMARSSTKYAVQLTDPSRVRYELEKAAALAIHGRPGPVWIDVPLDIQAAWVDPEMLEEFDALCLPSFPVPTEKVEETIRLLNQAERPVLLLGHGIRLDGGIQEARQVYGMLEIPVLTSWNGVDLIEEDHPFYYGRPGSVGHRAANFILQNADFVLSVGSRMSLLATGYNYESFLAGAVHVMVDIDPHEMEKKNLHPDVRIACGAKDFLAALLERKGKICRKDRGKWLDRCRFFLEKYPVLGRDQEAAEGFVSTYHLVDAISRQMTEEDIYQFTSSGTSVDIGMKVFRVKWGQRAFLTKGLAAMGYDIPACVGSCIASGGRRTVCVTGDGSAVMNMQELEVIRRRGLPVKLFVTDNQGYSMIYGSQKGNFEGRLTGCTRESGLTLPDLAKVAEAFGIRGMRIETEENLDRQVARVLEADGPVVCTVRTDIQQKVLPRQANYMREDGQMASRPLEDMAPLLDREELKECMQWKE